MGYSSNRSEIIWSSLYMKKSVVIQHIGILCFSILLLACTTPLVRTQKSPELVAPTPSQQFNQYPAAQYFLSSWRNLPHWDEDPLDQAWSAWQKSCQSLSKSNQAEWRQMCEKARTVDAHSNPAIRDYFETYFNVWEIRQTKDVKQFARASNEGLITSYYEPLLKGSLHRKGVYQTPLHRYPPSWQSSKDKLRPTRAALLSGHDLNGLEIAWVEDPVAAAFMQIQGSGKIQLENQKILRLGFAGTNNQTFASFGTWLINQNEITYAQASMQGISDWAKKNPQRVQTMLNANPRYVFFKVLESSTSSIEGPIGSMGVSLTAGRSIAVDWQAMPKGAPVYLSTTDPETGKPLERLVFAQDTGSAIVGGVRADYYWGSGDAAGDKAGKMKQSCRMWVILPKGLGE